jgi:hypothetical protein
VYRFFTPGTLSKGTCYLQNGVGHKSTEDGSQLQGAYGLLKEATAKMRNKVSHFGCYVARQIRNFSSHVQNKHSSNITDFV